MKTKKITEDYESTGNPCVDMIANAVEFYNAKSKRIKEIKLRSDYYDLLVEYIRKDTDVKLGTQLKWQSIDLNLWEEDKPTPMEIIFEFDEQI